MSVLANPDGNRAERRAAAKVARMSAAKRAVLPMAAETPQPGRWVTRAAGVNGR